MKKVLLGLVMMALACSGAYALTNDITDWGSGVYIDHTGILHISNSISANGYTTTTIVPKAGLTNGLATVTGGDVTLGTNFLVNPVSLKAGTVSPLVGQINLGTNVVETAVEYRIPNFSAAGGAIALRTNMLWANTIGPVLLPTNVYSVVGITTTIESTSKCSVVNGVITGQGL